jgi:hypothetical protein
MQQTGTILGAGYIDLSSTDLSRSLFSSFTEEIIKVKQKGATRIKKVIIVRAKFL